MFACQEQPVPGLWADGLPPGEDFLKGPQGAALHFSSGTSSMLEVPQVTCAFGKSW